jgi:multidrug efflux pump subunit AcrB
LPAGTAKIGDKDYQVKLNSSPRILDEMNRDADQGGERRHGLPGDVAQVRDGYAVQTSIVRTNGRRGALLTVMSNGKASTLDMVDNVKRTLPKILAGLPPALQVRQLFDQSVFVRAAINGVVREAVTAAFLTGLMILVFLGSWRSTVIVCISIPLSILTSLMMLSLLGETINVMTLGGFALAVGILVDDATVEIENTHRNMAMKKPLVRAVLDGAQQIAVPAFVSTLAICIVFVPVLLLTGAAKFLFTPLAMAVVFAMLASYFLSRTLIPNMVHYMLKPEVALYAQGSHGETARRQGPHLEGALHVQPPVWADADLLPNRCCTGVWTTAVRCWPVSEYSWRHRFRWRRSSDGTSSRPSIPAKCDCMPGRPPARASKRRRPSSPISKTKSGGLSRRARSRHHR